LLNQLDFNSANILRDKEEVADRFEHSILVCGRKSPGMGEVNVQDCAVCNITIRVILSLEAQGRIQDE
jgi:hypothetical protein